MAKKLSDLIKREHFRRSIIIEDRKRVIIEGCKKVVFINEERMTFEGECTVTVSGRGLKLIEMGNDTMAAEGTVDSVVFGEKNEKR